MATADYTPHQRAEADWEAHCQRLIDEAFGRMEYWRQVLVIAAAKMQPVYTGDLQAESRDRLVRAFRFAAISTTPHDALERFKAIGLEAHYPWFDLNRDNELLQRIAEAMGVQGVRERPAPSRGAQ